MREPFVFAMGEQSVKNRAIQFLDLPIDVLVVIFRHLDSIELAVLSRICRVLHKLVTNVGWATYVISRPRPSVSLSTHLASLASHGHARFIHLTDRAWASHDSVARPLTLNLYPVRDASAHLVVTPNVLVIAVANGLHVYDFIRGGLQVRWRGQVQLHPASTPHDDVTGLGVLPSLGGRETFFVGFANGKVWRVQLSQPGEPLRATVTAHYTHPPQQAITSLCASRWESKAALAVATAQGGLVSLYNTRSPWINPTRVDPATHQHVPGAKQPRTWCSLITRSDTLAITGSTRLALHPILPSGLLNQPPQTIPGPLKQSACYALSRSTDDHPNIILSGWYDGAVRLHDLRTETVQLSLRDPWSDSGVYCVGAGGGSGAHVVAGYSKHGMVAIFDIRSPSTAYTIYAPSPSLGPPRPRNGFTQVSALHVEASRIFGTTPHRPFVLDFGSDIALDTYPFVNENPHRTTHGGLGFVTQSYDHLVGLPR